MWDRRYSPVIHWFQKTQAYSLWWTAMTAWCKGGEGGVCEAAVSWAVRWGACCVCQQTVPSKRHRQGSSQARESSYPILQNLEHSAHLTHQPRCAPWIAELAVQSVTTLEMNKSQFFLPKSTLFFLPSAFCSFGKQMIVFFSASAVFQVRHSLPRPLSCTRNWFNAELLVFICNSLLWNYFVVVVVGLGLCCDE